MQESGCSSRFVLPLFNNFASLIFCLQMTQFCTSRRHAHAQDIQGNNMLTRSSSCPNFSSPLDSASAAQVRGMAKLMSLTSTSRRIVSLPSLPGLPSQCPTQTSAHTSSHPVHTSAPVPELTASEKAALEENNLKLDEMTAENELNKYLGDGLVQSSSSFDLVRFWDVSSLLLCIYSSLTFSLGE